MALIKCPECGKEISDKAPACINCGCPLPPSKNEVQAPVKNRAEYPKKKSRKMKWIIPISIVLVLVLGAGVLVYNFLFSSPFSFSENTDAIAKASASVVKIICYDYEGEEVATGSGFIYKDGVTVVTNYHVIKQAYTAKVSTDQDFTYEVYKVMHYSEDKDIAILSLRANTGLQPLEIGDPALLQKGETVTAIGSPLGIKNTVSQGVFSGRIYQNAMDILQFTAPISHGSSGGALIAEDGSVVGVTFASYDDGQNLNLAIPISEVVTLDDAEEAALYLSNLYTKNYPYVGLLIKYKNAAEVSLEELKAAPQKYDDKVIKINTYISSLSGGIGYCSNYDDISGDFDFDLNHTTYRNFEDHKILAFGYSKDAYYCIPEVGNNIVAVGLFDYSEVGESINIGEMEYVWEYSNGVFRPYVVYNGE